MMKDMYRKISKLFCLGWLIMTSCAIENDIPFPMIEAGITAMEVEGQRAAENGQDIAAKIDKKTCTVTIYVNDSVDISRLKIKSLVVDPGDAELLADSVACVNYGKFPKKGFSSLDDIPLSANTRIDFKKPVSFVLKTYQDYVWKVVVNQIIQRDIEVQGMVGKPVIDVQNRTVIIKVSKDQDLKNLNVIKLNLGGAFGRITPDPTLEKDYSSPKKFNVRRSWEEYSYEWTVHVYHEDNEQEGESNVFPMVSRAILKGTVTSGKRPVIEYREQGSSTWEKASDIKTSGVSYTATLTGLKGSKSYQYRVNVDNSEGTIQSFTTVAAVALENGSLEEWSKDGNRWNPWKEGTSPFWGTGNKGSSIISSIGNITSPTDESVSGKAAYLESKNAMLKLASGNLFAGDFDLDGIDGLLHFGRPFTSFPTALRLHYKYTTAPITIVGSTIAETLPKYMRDMVGQPDSCHVYIALSDKSTPYEIKNNPKKRQLFDKNDANIIAYGEFVSGNSVSGYQQIDIPLVYRDYRTPKYLVLVCSSSKYGDYYLGGVGSKLWIDEMELIYE